MRTLLVLLCSVAVLAEEQLGVITRYRPLVLVSDTNRTDLVAFEVAVLPYYSTNRLLLIKTNRLLMLSDLNSVPAGKATVEITALYEDGDRSPTLVGQIELLYPPMRPKTTNTVLNRREAQAHTFDELMEIKRQARATNAPPALITTGEPVSMPFPPGYGEWPPENYSWRQRRRSE